MAKEVVFKVGDFVTPIKTGNAISLIYEIDEASKKPFKVLTLTMDGYPDGDSSRYLKDDLKKVPRKYRDGWPTGKEIIKMYEAL